MPVAQAFASLDPVAIGSASLAQVHRATLPGGEQVVVKVMRPDTERMFRTDFVYMNGYAWILGHIPFIDRGIAGIIREVIELTSRELDFRREAQNMVEMRQLMLEDEIDHDAPLLYPRLSGAHTITMEYIEGVSISQMLHAVDERDTERLATWAEQNITPRRAAHLILRSVLEQTMHHRQFQADPHASNMIMRPGGTLSWLDFGVMGWLDERLWHQQLDVARGHRRTAAATCGGDPREHVRAGLPFPARAVRARCQGGSPGLGARHPTTRWRPSRRRAQGCCSST